MSISVPFDLTGCRRFFDEPAPPRQREYEALRAFFMEGLASAEVARRFGYSPAGFRMLCYDFRRGELPDFLDATGAAQAAQEEPRPRAGRGATQAQLLNLRHQQGAQAAGNAAERQPRYARSWLRRALLLCHAGSTRSARHLLGPPRRRWPMSPPSSSARASSPQGSEGYSYSSPI